MYSSNVVLRFSLVIFLSFGLLACSSSKSSKKGDGSGGIGDLSENDLNAMQDDRFGSGSIPTAQGGGLFRDVNFDFNSSQVDDIARQNIEYNIEILKQNPSLSVVLEGHCDERGTAEYNMALGQERSLSVNKILQSYGVTGNRVRTISYGEEIPLDPTAQEAAWAKNRRVHFAGYGQSETTQQ